MVTINLTKVEDKELMHLLAGNDLNAWSELVKRYGKLVFSIAYHILNNSSDTEDAAQNTFVRLKIYASKFDNSLPLKPWLSRIASGEAIRIYNKKKDIRKKEAISMDTQNSSIFSKKKEASEIIEQKEVEVMVKKAIASLPETSRVALTLYYAGGMNQSEIANELGISQVRISLKIKSGLEAVKAYLKNAGIHASIIISPSFLQENLVSTIPPKEFFDKLTNNFPAEAQIARIAATSLRIGVSVANNKRKILWLWYLLGISIISIIAFIFWPFKQDPAITLVKPMEIGVDKPNNDSVVSNKEKSAPTKEIFALDPFYYKWGKIQKEFNKPEMEETHILTYGGKTNWHYGKKTNMALTRKFIGKDVGDGMFLRNKFTQAFTMSGKILMTSKGTGFGFVLGTPFDAQNKTFEINYNKNEAATVSGYNSKIGDLFLEDGGERDFKVFIWQNDNKWNSVCFYKIPGEHVKNEFNFSTLDFTSKEFIIGFYSNAACELSNMTYRTLESSWDPINEQEVKDVIEKFPNGFLKVSTDKK